MQKTFHIVLFLLLGLALHLAGQNHRRIDSLQLMLKKTGPDDKKRARILASLGWEISYNNLEEGLEYAEQAIELASQKGYTFEHAYALNVAGTIYMDLGNYPMATDYLLKSSQQYGLVNDKKGQAIAAGNLGIVYARRGEFRKSLAEYQKEYLFFKNSGNNDGYISTLLNMGNTYYKLHLLDSARSFLEEALKSEYADSLEKSSAYNTLGNCYAEEGDLKMGRAYLLKAVRSIDSTQKYYLAEHHIALARIEGQLRNFPAAVASLDKALAYSREIGVKEFVKDCYEAYSQVYEWKGDLTRSLAAYKQYSAIKDSMLNQENEHSIKFMEAKFETEKKEKEIQLLNKDKKLNDEKLKRDSIVINAFIYGGIVLVLALGLVIYAFVNKRKANRKLVTLNNEVHRQRNQLLEKNQSITDSLQYASRIQSALLTSEHYIRKFIPDFFIINKPKDIVSGDFYWAYFQDGKLYFMCADCTGHGVPGAFMSLLGVNFLNEIVIEKKITSPDAVLNELRREIILSLNPQGSEDAKDGMDCTFCSINVAQFSVDIAAANNPVWIIRPPAGGLQQDKQGKFKMAPGFKLTELKPDKMPVGKSPKDTTPFTLKSYQLKQGDCIYMFSDGIADQFGGPKGKKMKYKLLKETILKHCHLPMAEQKGALQQHFDKWKDGFEQVDDVLVIGIRV